MLVTWDVEAIELGLLDKRYELITLGNSYKVDNQFLYAVERLQVIEKKFSILAPQKVRTIKQLIYRIKLMIINILLLMKKIIDQSFLIYRYRRDFNAISRNL